MAQALFDAGKFEEELAAASAKADVQVGASCACALESWGKA